MLPGFVWQRAILLLPIVWFLPFREVVRSSWHPIYRPTMVAWNHLATWRWCLWALRLHKWRAISPKPRQWWLPSNRMHQQTLVNRRSSPNRFMTKSYATVVHNLIAYYMIYTNIYINSVSSFKDQQLSWGNIIFDMKKLKIHAYRIHIHLYIHIYTYKLSICV